MLLQALTQRLSAFLLLPSSHPSPLCLSIIKLDIDPFTVSMWMFTKKNLAWPQLSASLCSSICFWPYQICFFFVEASKIPIWIFRKDLTTRFISIFPDYRSKERQGGENAFVGLHIVHHPHPQHPSSSSQRGSFWFCFVRWRQSPEAKQPLRQLSSERLVILLGNAS